MSIVAAGPVIGQRLKHRALNGAHVVVTEIECKGPLLVECKEFQLARLGVLLDEIGGVCEPRLKPETACGAEHVRCQVNFAPGNVQTWGYSRGIRYFRLLTVLFDVSQLEEQLLERLGAILPRSPQLQFEEDKIFRLGQLLAEECDEPQLPDSLYGSSLVAAIFARYAERCRADRATPNRTPGGLSRRQLVSVTEHLEQTPGRVELRELALMTGLSQSHFCHAFKLSTGMPPYRWHLVARIRRARELLMQDQQSIAEVALATGFADQAHFTRVFKKVVGVTPRAWLRARA